MRPVTRSRSSIAARPPSFFVAATVAMLVASLLPASAVGPFGPRPASAADPSTVTIAGSLQSELGCAGDWDPACPETELTYDAADDVWQHSFAVPEGTWEYKAALNDSWDLNYGAGAKQNGPNIGLAVPTGDTNPTKFYYDDKSHWITSDRNTTIAVAPGSFQSELGCAGDWDPGCLRSWLEDPDGDGTFAFETTAIPAGSYEAKVALNESWDVNYGAGGVQNGPNIGFSVSEGDIVTFSYDGVSHVLTITAAPPDGGLEPGDELLVGPSLRELLTDQVFYFALPDRFETGDPTNDTGGITGGALDNGFLPTNKGYYHGGDLAGVTEKLGYLDDLGVTAVWLAPIFENRPVQGDGTIAGSSAGYHGYWITDFTQVDPHFGTNAQLQALVDAAHARGIKIFLDVVVNHTADVIDYENPGNYAYRNKGTYPYIDANGLEFDDRDYVGGDTFPPLDPATSFPYQPIFRTTADETVKAPAWLNDPTNYHNRGNSTFAGESSRYGDFVGLDDLFTEQPDVVDGFVDLAEGWITDFDIDGFRLDTAKHVNTEFWQAFAPEVTQFAKSAGKNDFFMFGEVFDGNPAFTSIYTTEAQLTSVLDFGFQGKAQTFAALSGATNDLRDFFAQDDLYTDTDSNAYSLTTFLGNHDMGRIGRFISASNPGASDTELLARDELAHALMFLSRGMPVVYYGDEQGFTGDGGDKDARQDMFASQVASYNDDDLIGTSSTTAVANFNPGHPLYQTLADLAALKAAHPALASGAQVQRYSTATAGLYAFSRIDRDEQVEYVVVLNNAETSETRDIQTYSAEMSFSGIYPAGLSPLTSDADGKLSVTVPGLSAVVYRADASLATRTRAPGINLVAPADGAAVTGRVEVGANVTGNEFAEVTFAVKVGDATEWTVLGTDDNAPFRVFHDVSDLAPGTVLQYKAIVRDNSGNLNADKASAVVGESAPPPPPGATRDYAVVHYTRADGDYDGWGVHFWGDIDPAELEQITWQTPRMLVGEDDYGRFAWVKLVPGAASVGFIVHNGDTKDPPDLDRFFNPSTNPEIWVKEGAATIYTSQAAAQGFVDIRYQRPDGIYDGWGLHLWGDAIADGVATDWASPRLPDEVDDYGAHWIVPIEDATLPVNFIVHNGDTKDPPDLDRSFVPTEQPAVWLKSADATVYGTRGAAEDFAIIHYHRDDGDYGDPTSSDFRDFWGMHVWTGSAETGIEWGNPLRPIGQDGFGLIFKIRLVDDAASLSYIIHRGDTKDPPDKDQSLDFATFDHEVWYLSGHYDSERLAKYLLPMLPGGPGVDANLHKQKAHWLTRDTIAWNIDPIPGGRYYLNLDPDGGMTAGDEGLSGEAIQLSRVAFGLSPALQAAYPHLAGYGAFRIPAAALARVPEALQGQVAVSAVDDEGRLRIATGVQIPGVLDDRYSYGGDLGVSIADDTPVLRLWAPTAKSVALQLFADSNASTTGTLVPMTRDDETGVWSVTGEPSWIGRFYLYDVEIYAPTVDEVVHNLVTDPYSLALATNSTRSEIVDLSDPSLAPAGWAGLTKPALAAPEDISIYELHLRDFSINDATVPAADRGTYLAFADTNSDGMRHLRELTDAGLTHLHLLPVFDIATIDENRANHEQPPCDLASFPGDSDQQQACIAQVRDSDGFNWGYDPWHYTVPEGSYATNPDGATRTLEFRRMVQAINQSGLRVVMDVVYNHTNAAGQAPKSVLDRIVPGYYHRLDLEGGVTNSTCCANTATEHAMMEKLMVDSVVTWARQYKVDGFRFDLMGHHSKANMLNVRAALDALTLAKDGVDGKKIYIYGEGWNFGEVANNARFEQASQLNMAGTGIGTFNDRLRDAVRGGGPFDADQRIRQGFASGLYYDPNGHSTASLAEQKETLLLLADQIRVGLTGNLKDYQFVDRTGATVTGSQVDYNGSPAGYTSDPQEAITYVSAHDNETLYDILAYKLPQATSMADRVRAQVLALSTVALGQGVAFFHAGSDLLRSKSLDKNSYNSGDWFNRLFFDESANNFGVGLPQAQDNAGAWPFMQPLLADPDLRADHAAIATTTSRFQEFLEIRNSSPLFRLGTAEEIQARLTFYNTGPSQIPGVIVMRIADSPGADLDPQYDSIVVVFNATDEAQTVIVGGAQGHQMQLHPIQRRGTDQVVKTSVFNSGKGRFTIPARTTAVFVERETGG